MFLGPLDGMNGVIGGPPDADKSPREVGCPADSEDGGVAPGHAAPEAGSRGANGGIGNEFCRILREVGDLLHGFRAVPFYFKV